MTPVSCSLCFKVLNKKNSAFEAQNLKSYRKTLFQCSQRLLKDTIEDDSFTWTPWNENSTLFCLDCFLSSEKLRQVDTKLQNMKLEFHNYTKSFPNEICQRRLSALSRNDTFQDGDIKYESTCLMCFEPIYDSMEYEYEAYVQKIFQACDRLLSEKIKGKLFNWTFSCTNSHPFCFNCFKLSEKLWEMEECLKTTKLELEGYIDLFSTEILQSRIKILFKSSSTSCKAKPSSDVKFLDDQFAKTDGVLICQNETSNHSNSVPSLVSENSKTVVIMEIIKSEPLNVQVELDDIPFESFEDDLLSQPEESFIDDWHPVNDPSCNGAVCTKNETESKQRNNVSFQELRVVLHRLQLDCNGKVILPQSGGEKLRRTKRTAAIAAAALWRNAIAEKKEFGNKKTKKVSRDLNGDLSDYSVEDMSSDSDECETETPKRKFAMSKIKHPKNGNRTTCGFCGKVSLTHMNHRVHVAQHYKEINKGRVRFTCSICDIGFFGKREMQEHFSRHTDEKRYKCAVCPALLVNKKMLNCHKRHHKVLTNVQCPVCHLFFKHDKSLSIHVKVHSAENLIQCDMCDKRFEYIKYLHAHKILAHGGHTPFKCKHCKKYLPCRIDLTIHLRLVHKKERYTKRFPGPPYQCDLCPNSYKILETLRGHRFEAHNRDSDAEYSKFSDEESNSASDSANQKSDKSANDQESQQILRSETNLRRRKCKICGQISPSFIQHRKHVKGHNRKRNYKCHLCDNKYFSLQQLKGHMNSHTGENPYKCKLCPAAFRRHTKLYLHKIGHALKTNVQCPTCFRFYKDKFQLKHHQKVHREESFCDKCKLSFESNRQLLAHKVTVHGAPGYRCPHCEKMLANRLNLNFHLKIFHQGKPQPGLDKDEEKISKKARKSKSLRRLRGSFKCAECSCAMILRSAQELDDHAKQTGHVNERTFVCTFQNCTFKYYRKYDLDMHMEVHERKNRTCKFCGKDFPPSSSFYKYRAHLNIHYRRKKGGLRKRKFQCHLCEKSYFENCALQEHLLKHTGEKPWKCNLCPASFVTRRDLKDHTGDHNIKIKLQCPTCHLFYANQNSLDRHVKIHNEENWKHCNCCEKLFELNHQLIAHKMSEHGAASPYECDHCGKMFSNNNDLKFHVKIAHPDTNTVIDIDDGDFGTLPKLQEPEPFKCAECLLIVSSYQELEDHSVQTGHVNERTFLCSVENCTKKYYRQIDLTTHKKNCHKIASRNCNFCKIVLESSSYEYKLHLNRHYKQRQKLERGFNQKIKFPCTDSPATFQTLSLKAHETEHSVASNVQCQKCHLFYPDETTLSTHMETHNRDTNPHFCEFCPKSFITLTNLGQHLLKAHGKSNQQKPKNQSQPPPQRYPCTQCDNKIFSQKSKLNQHIKVIHTKEISFTCDICEKTLLSSTSLRLHLKIHEGTTIDCSICGRGFFTSTNLKEDSMVRI